MKWRFLVNTAVEELDHDIPARRDCDLLALNARAQIVFHDFYHTGKFKKCSQHPPQKVGDIVDEAMGHFLEVTKRYNDAIATRPHIAKLWGSLEKLLEEIDEMQLSGNYTVEELLG